MSFTFTKRARFHLFYLITVLLGIFFITRSNNTSFTPPITATTFTSSTSSGHLVVSGDKSHWTSSRSQNNLPLGIRIAFRTRDTGEFGVRTDDPCYKNADDVKNLYERTMELPPTLIDVRSAREWEEGLTLPLTPTLVNKRKTNLKEREGNSNSNDRGGRILDFSTSVATDLNIVFLGDSVAEQLSEAFESAATGVPGDVAMQMAEDQSPGSTLKVPSSPKVLLETFGVRGVGNNRPCVFASAPVRGGGAVLLWRVVKLLSISREGMLPCNSMQGGWNRMQFMKMIGHEFQNDPEVDVDDNGRHNVSQAVRTVGMIDAIVLRIQLGWMKPPAITREGILETISLCRDFLGAQTVVIMTINFTNDVHNPNEWKWASNMNKEMREMAREFNQNSTDIGGNFRVQIMEFSDFTTQVHWANARTILAPSSNTTYEYPNLGPPNVSLPDYEQKEEAGFLFDRFKKWSSGNMHPHSIPTVCAQMKDKYIDKKGVERKNCIRNAIMRDGLHWCQSSVGPRYHAGLACLLGCVYNDKETTSEGTGGGEIEKCERTCNDQFMSLVPIDEAWLEQDTTLFSRS